MSPYLLLFWIAAFLLVYTYAGYPLVVAWRSRRRQRAPERQEPFEPAVSILVAAHNEEGRIARRLQNLLALDYPRHRVEIVVGSDGSTDATAERARQFQARGVKTYAFAFRRGKPAMLNDLVPRARGEIVVMADARQEFAPDALRALVAPFRDPRVGAVSGELMINAEGAASPVGDGVGAYWRYEKRIRRAESAIDSTVGVTGAIYAIRRSLYRPIPDDTILDDVLVPMQVVRQGYRVVFEGGALAFDRASGTGREEFTRKTRTLAGTYQLFVRHGWLLHPRRNRLWMQTVSHKALRLLAPLCLIGVLVGAAALSAHPFYLAALAGQVVFYGAAVCGAVARAQGWRSRLLSLPYTFCLMNGAALIAFWRFITGRQRVTWERGRPVGAPAWSVVRSNRIRS